MEWHGINLSGYHHIIWQRRSITLFIRLGLVILLSILFALPLYYFAKKIEMENRAISQRIQQKELNKMTMAHQIEQLKQLIFFPANLSNIKKGEMTQIVNFLQTLPIQGGIEQVSISQTNNIQISLSGKLNTSDFEKLEQHIKNNSLSYQIIQLQSDKHHQLQFNLLIEWGAEDEKMVK